MLTNKKRHFVKLPYSNLYVLYGEGPYPRVFIDDVEKMVYTYAHKGFEGPTYWGKEIS